MLTSDVTKLTSAEEYIQSLLYIGSHYAQSFK